jgi:uncharacterized membrane protein YbhN (UPF0104 family)
VTRKSINRLTLAVALIMFVGALFVLYQELRNTRLKDVADYVAALPRTRLLGAAALTAASYLLLTGYDFLALNYAGRALRFWQVVFASFIAFAFSHTLGFALVSGGSMRYRIYSGFGLTAFEIGEVIAFCILTYALGVAAVAGLMFVLNPAELASILNLPQQFLLIGGIVLLGIVVAYVVVVGTRWTPISVGRYKLRLPTVGQSILQIALASVDQVLAGTVLYALLPPHTTIDFATFLGMYVIAAPLSFLSLVPGGVGVFETALVVMLGQTPKAASLASLVAYRCIYFLLPLALAVTCDAVYELRRASRLDWSQ